MLRKLIQNEFLHARNRELHTENLTKELEGKLEYMIFDYCCSLVKQVQCGIPQEKIREWFRGLF
jgi:hypothetical protein